jgi:hypothetical protein
MSLTKLEMRLLKDNALEIHQSAHALRKLLKKVEHVYITDEEYEEGGEKIYDESTILRWSDKHNMPMELVVMKIKEGGTLVCNGIYDTYGENKNMEISVDVVSYGDLASLATLLPDNR